MFKRIKAFFEGVQFEFKKISWPTFEELRGSTWVVLFMSGLLAVILFIMDKVMSVLIMDIILGR